MAPQFATNGIFFRAYLDSDAFGKGIFLGLFALSLICWFLIVQKGWIFYHVKKLSSNFQSTVLKQKENLSYWMPEMGFTK